MELDCSQALIRFTSENTIYFLHGFSISYRFTAPHNKIRTMTNIEKCKHEQNKREPAYCKSVLNPRLGNHDIFRTVFTVKNTMMMLDGVEENTLTNKCIHD